MISELVRYLLWSRECANMVENLCWSWSFDLNRIQAIRDLEVRATVIFTSKIHALNTLKMAPLLRSNVMRPYGVSDYFELVRLVEQ
jgi:hypothetical protein